MPTTRRGFLSNSALTLFGFGTAPAWLERTAFPAPPSFRTGKRKILVAVFLRGAMDGLNVVVPYGDRDYASLRPTLKQEARTLTDLDGFFGLHSALADWKPLWEQKQLAIVHASGSPDPTRSHFDAQDYMESGTPGRKSTRDGWLNRALAPQPNASAIRAVSVGPSLARTLRGANPAVAVNGIENFRVRDNAQEAFDAMYAKSPDLGLKGTGHDTFEAVKLLESIAKERSNSMSGGYPATRFGRSMEQIARLIKAGAGLEVAFTDIPGWDTHINQTPRLTGLLNDLAKGLLAFERDLGPAMEDIVVVTMSEFGRAARENGNRGTDHGHANAMFVLGGGVKGGQVYGEWPGLSREQLYEGRDLALTTDFRDVLGEVVTRHLGHAKPAEVFPGYSMQPESFRGLLG